MLIACKSELEIIWKGEGLQGGYTPFTKHVVTIIQTFVNLASGRILLPQPPQTLEVID